MSLVLASASPRRKELIGRVASSFIVVPSAVDERPPQADENPVDYAIELACTKAAAVARTFPSCAVLAADTVVAVDGLILNKPESPADALRMLSLLRGRWHEVTSAVAICSGFGVGASSVTAAVRMRSFSPAEAEAYVRGGEPMDKAGAYAVQGEGGILVDRVIGCYSTVVGLPLCLTQELLAVSGRIYSTGLETCPHR